MKINTAKYLVCLAALYTAAAQAQTRIGSWSFEEAALSLNPDEYFIEAKTGNPNGPSGSSIDFYCDKRNYTFHLLPPGSPGSARNDLPDGIWTVQLSINNQPGIAFTGQSSGGMINASLSKEQVSALFSARARMPVPDVLTTMIEKTDGGRIQRAVNFPATGFHAAMNTLAAACEHP